MHQILTGRNPGNPPPYRVPVYAPLQFFSVKLTMDILLEPRKKVCDKILDSHLWSYFDHILALIILIVYYNCGIQGRS